MIWSMQRVQSMVCLLGIARARTGGPLVFPQQRPALEA